MELEISDFICSDEGFDFLEEYEKKFNASFVMLEPDGNSLLIDLGSEIYEVPNDETVDNFKRLISQSIETCVNEILRIYKRFKIVYKPWCVY